MRLSEFDYNLPKKYIAHMPAEPRDHSKLMVLHRDTEKIEHRYFYNIVDYFKKGDVVVVNNSKVMAARLFGQKSTGARVEVLLLHREDDNLSSFIRYRKTREIVASRICTQIYNADKSRIAKCSNAWQVLVKPAKRLHVGDEVYFEGSGGQRCDAREGDVRGKIPPSRNKCGTPPFWKGGNTIRMKIIKELEEGIRVVKFNTDVMSRLDEIGIVPLPPYIKLDNAQLLKERYQTVYSKIIGSAAAPTAGLHFTPELIKNLKKKGVIFKEVTLHIGLDTFKPLTAENIKDHKIHQEYCELDGKVAMELNNAKKNGSHIIAVGTTTARVLESACDGKGVFSVFKGWTDIFIYPGYKFKAVDALITNFHLPKSSLLLLVSAFCGDKEQGKKLILSAYNEAKKRKYRFFSFGDSMLIL